MTDLFNIDKIDLGVTTEEKTKIKNHLSDNFSKIFGDDNDVPVTFTLIDSVPQSEE